MLWLIGVKALNIGSCGKSDIGVEHQSSFCFCNKSVCFSPFVFADVQKLKMMFILYITKLCISIVIHTGVLLTNLSLPFLTCPIAIIIVLPPKPFAPHVKSPSVYREDRCFDYHPPPLALWIHSLLWLLSHLQLQSCRSTYKDRFHLTCFCLPESDFLGPSSVILCYTSSPCLPPSISSPVWPFNSVPWQSPSWGLPCLLVRVIITVIMNVRRQRQTVGIYYRLMRINGGTEGSEERHALTVQMQVHGEGTMVK